MWVFCFVLELIVCQCHIHAIASSLLSVVVVAYRSRMSTFVVKFAITSSRWRRSLLRTLTVVGPLMLLMSRTCDKTVLGATTWHWLQQPTCYWSPLESWVILISKSSGSFTHRPASPPNVGALVSPWLTSNSPTMRLRSRWRETWRWRKWHLAASNQAKRRPSWKRGCGEWNLNFTFVASDDWHRGVVARGLRFEFNLAVAGRGRFNTRGMKFKFNPCINLISTFMGKRGHDTWRILSHSD